MGTDKRQRKKANRATRLQMEQKAARRRSTIRRVVTLVAVVIGALALALLFSLLAADDADASGPSTAVAALVGAPPARP